MNIERTGPIEFHERMAEREDAAAAASASLLSYSTDPSQRERLAKKMRRSKEQAEFHRATAARLREESEGEQSG